MVAARDARLHNHRTRDAAGGSASETPVSSLLQSPVAAACDDTEMAVAARVTLASCASRATGLTTQAMAARHTATTFIGNSRDRPRRWPTLIRATVLPLVGTEEPAIRGLGSKDADAAEIRTRVPELTGEKSTNRSQ